MPQYHDNIVVISLDEWLSAGLSYELYKSDRKRGYLRTVNRASFNNSVLIEFDSLKEMRKSIIKAKYGDPREQLQPNTFATQLKMDGAAFTFFSNYILTDGRRLPEENIREYVANASVLNGVSTVIKSRIAMRRALGGRANRGEIWENLAQSIAALDRGQWAHTLPANSRRLKEKHRIYEVEGYTSLIHKNFGNQVARKVNVDIERLVLSLYCLPNKPYLKTTHDLYLQFLSGDIDVYDVESGELFNRDDFFNDNGEPIVLSASTINNYINDPKNRVIVDKVRTGSLEFQQTHRPHHHRTGPNYSLSKISMDDRDLPRKLHDGSRVKAYYAYDVASGCVIGAAYSKNKDTGLFIDCMRDMFRLIDSNGLGMPMEVEVEHHLVNRFKDDLMKAGVVFPFVRWCAPGNSQEKYAEVLNRVKKYGYEKKYQNGIGRFYAKIEANRPKVDKIWDEGGMKIKESTYSFEQLVAEDRQVIERYNNDIHPNQKKYKGMTRMDVLLKCKNPNLADINKALVARYIGEKVLTSIKRSGSVTVQYAEYLPSTPEIIEKLQPNNYNVEAYYMPTESGEIGEVYIYQNGEFIDTCTPMPEYNTARAEQTEADFEAITAQSKYVNQFDAMVKRGKKNLAKVGIIENNQDEPKAVETSPVKPEPVTINQNFDIDAEYDAEYYSQLGADSL